MYLIGSQRSSHSIGPFRKLQSSFSLSKLYVRSGFTGTEAAPPCAWRCCTEIRTVAAKISAIRIWKPVQMASSCLSQPLRRNRQGIRSRCKRMNLGDIAARELHDRRFSLIGRIRANQDADTGGLRLGKGTVQVRALVSGHL